MWLKWLPWKWIISRAAKSRGFLDPVTLLSHLRRFSEPSEVSEPIELLRAGAVFHARGLVNSRAIQHNLDWIWPHWVERQFDPRDASFVPRAFSLTHINMTQRNWTGFGLPNCLEIPIVDPRGLATPLYDGWSVDAWILAEDGRRLIPSRAAEVEQRLCMDNGMSVATETREPGLTLRVTAEALNGRDAPACVLRFSAQADAAAWLAVSLRPCNPEGVSFVHSIRLREADDPPGWRINDKDVLEFSHPCARHALSNYKSGDVYHLLPAGNDVESIHCDIGLATAAALFPILPGGPAEVEARVSLADPRHEPSKLPRANPIGAWPQALHSACALNIPDETVQFLYEASVRSLVLLSPGDVFPGPYTYKRFWFRDAAFILNALMCVNLLDRVEPILNLFPERQTHAGFFHSQDGEWDSNGEALWTFERFCRLAGVAPKPAWYDAVHRGGDWIVRKRLPAGGEAPHAGLMPAGFSAEHLGVNDFYYWDDFWSVAGLRSAARMMRDYGAAGKAVEFDHEANDLLAAIERSLDLSRRRLGRPAMPAAPSRRYDAGAIGSIVADHPLQIFPPGDERLTDTVAALEESCLVDGGFFQDMIHSGINPYLTLHLAQAHLRAGNPLYLERMDCVARLASATGQWPEAVHPRTGGGCMGDGHHTWASADWAMMIRSCFVREESHGDRLILGAGIPARWLEPRRPISFGPTPTVHGNISLEITLEEGGARLTIQADWREPPRTLEARVPGFSPAILQPGETSVRLSRSTAP